MGKFLLTTVKFLVAFCLLSVFQVKESKASHAMGADLTYECLGGNQYRFTYSFYRDCSGIPAPPTVTVNLTSGCYANSTVVLTAVAVTPDSLRWVYATCPGARTTCASPPGTNLGIEEWLYVGIVNLPGPCNNWNFGVSLNARNPAITTIDNPGSQTLYVYSLLNNVDAPCNSSPTFSNKPVPFACVGQQFNFNHGAYDADGDSIVYSLITPKISATADVLYNFPYTYTTPVVSPLGALFNPSSGDFTVQPSQPDVTVFAVLVSEYRNGILIGQVERDIQLTVTACTNIIPVLYGINNSPSHNKTICANAPFTFFSSSFDADLDDTTRVTWDGGIPGATVATTGLKNDTMIFSWTPTTADISPIPQCFTATVKDDNCPYVGQSVYSFCFTVCGVTANAGLDQSVICGATANLNGVGTTGCGGMTYRWLPSGIAGQALNGVGVGDYYLEVTAGAAACKDTDTVSVHAGVGVAAANFTFATNCSGLPVQFTDQSVNAANWSWDFGDLSTSSSQNPTHTYSANGTYTVKLVITSSANCKDSLTQQVTVNTNIPSAVFTAAPKCIGAVSNFADNSTGGPFSTWAWNFNDPASGASNISSLQNPTHTFSGSGTFQVTLNVTNTSGCSNLVQQNVVVNANPVVVVADATICLGAQTTLTAPGGYITYSWAPGGTTQTINVSPIVNSAYNITVTDANSCQGSHVVNVTVNPLPAVTAGSDQTICQGTAANLSGGGGGPGAAYNWTPGNLAGQNVSVSPPSTTDYTVTGTDAVGCSNTDVLRIIVNPMPVVDAGNDGGICKGNSITLAVVAGSGSYNWAPGGETTSSITVSPIITTTYTLTVSDGIGCAGIDEVTVVVNPLPVASFNSTAPVCAGTPVAFNDASNIPSGSISSWSWLFGNGQTSAQQSPNATYNTAGGYNVKLLITSNAGCKDSSTNAININPIPTADAGTDASICPGFNGTLIGTGGTQYSWNPGGYTTSSITVSPGATTSYTLQVTDANGCTNSDQAQIIVNPVPIASAGADQNICFGQATSLFASGIGNYTWTPGNVNTANFNINPNTTTTYTVRVINSAGCEDFDEVTVNVNPLPISSFNSSGPVCQHSNVSFTDLSNIGGGVINSWEWDLGNGSLSTNQNPSLAYQSAGSYNINLIVTSDQGCKDTSNSILTIWAEPVASFVNTNVCDGIPIQFTNTSTISDATPLVHSWNLGDGTASANSSPSHLYTGYGSYQATLNVSSAHGCTNTISRAVNVFALPTADFIFDPACEDSPAQFNDRSTIPDGNVSAWYWAFGDGNVGTLPSPSHTFADEGSYPINLLVTSNHACQDSISAVIRIIPRPVVDFTTENACQGTAIQLSDLSYPITGAIVQYTWNFGDGSSVIDQNPVHLYSSPGWYEVSLTVETDSGCTTTLARPNALQIYRAPDAQFASSAEQANDIYPLINFVNETGSAGFYHWNFGDGETSEEYSPTHMYPDVGAYDVQLITIDYNGCIDSIYQRVEIRPSSAIYIPNSFTPNGDRKNDLFKIYTHNVVRLEAQVFDRWGLKVYEWDSLDGGWDGIVKGNPVQSDVYVYRVSTVDVNNKRETRIGHVSLVR